MPMSNPLRSLRLLASLTSLYLSILCKRPLAVTGLVRDEGVVVKEPQNHQTLARSESKSSTTSGVYHCTFDILWITCPSSQFCNKLFGTHYSRAQYDESAGFLRPVRCEAGGTAEYGQRGTLFERIQAKPALRQQFLILLTPPMSSLKPLRQPCVEGRSR